MATFTLNYTGQTDPLTFNVLTNAVTNGFTGTDTTVEDELIHFGYAVPYDADNDLFEITGTGLADVITAGNGGSKLTGGGGGGDILTGGAGKDLFTYEGNEIVGDDTIAGGGKKDAIVISGGNPNLAAYFGNAGISGVERVIFEENQLDAAFLTTQVGVGRIREFIAPDEDSISVLVSFVLPSAQTFDLNTLTFTNWLGKGSFRTTEVSGSNGDDVIKAHKQLAIRIDGGLGADKMTGGGGDDTFGFGGSVDLAAGESINGKGGFDSLFFFLGGNCDFTKVSLSSIERLSIDDEDDATFNFKGSQVGNGAIEEINGTTAGIELIVKGGKANLAGLDLVDWSDNDSVTIIGTKAADTLTGSVEDDLLRGGKGDDKINGRGGFDTLDFSDQTKAIVLALDGSAFATAKIGGKAADKVKNAEGIIGGTGKDKLTGDDNANTLNGGAGEDTLRGKGGADTFVFDSADAIDHILDFATGEDTIALSLSVYLAAGLVEGLLNGENFVIGIPFEDDQYFSFANGTLTFDSNGSDAGGTIVNIVTLQAGATLFAGDIELIA